MAVAPSHSGLRVLVVDGNRAVVTIMQHGLAEQGVEVVTATDGASALRALVDHLLGLDLLVTGVELPVLDGRTLVRIVRAEGGETELPILVLAPAVSAADRAHLARLGVTEIVEQRQGVDHAVRRAVALATIARDRRVEALGAGDPYLAVPVGRLATPRGLGPR